MFNHRARTLCDRPVCDLTFSVQASKWVLNVLLTAAGRVVGRTLPPYPLFDLSPIFPRDCISLGQSKRGSF